MKPLFIPLKRIHYLAFESGEKVEEFRLYGKRWNEKTCTIGRPAVLSLGYGKKHRMNRVITSFRTEQKDSADWIGCYGKPGLAACIGLPEVTAQSVDKGK